MKSCIHIIAKLRLITFLIDNFTFSVCILPVSLAKSMTTSGIISSICALLQSQRCFYFDFNFSLANASCSGLFQDSLRGTGANPRHSQR